MKHSRRDLLLAFGGVLSYARFGSVYAQDFASYTDADREAFLLGGKVVSIQDIGEGVTKPIRAELGWKGIMHSAQIQRVDRALPDIYFAPVEPYVADSRAPYEQVQVDRALPDLPTPGEAVAGAKGAAEFFTR